MVKKLSPSEFKIMDICWNSPEALSVYDIMDILDRQEGGTQWKWQTVSTFLRRLMEKGYLNNCTRVRTYYYTPRLNREQYHNLEAKDFLNRMFEGSLQKFLIALTLDKQELSESAAVQIEKCLDFLKGC